MVAGRGPVPAIVVLARRLGGHGGNLSCYRGVPTGALSWFNGANDESST